MRTMLTAWTIQLRTALARLELAMWVGSLPIAARPIARNLFWTSTTQHQPWTWVLALYGARKRP